MWHVIAIEHTFCLVCFMLCLVQKSHVISLVQNNKLLLIIYAHSVLRQSARDVVCYIDDCAACHVTDNRANASWNPTTHILSHSLPAVTVGLVVGAWNVALCNHLYSYHCCPGLLSVCQTVIMRTLVFSQLYFYPVWSANGIIMSIHLSVTLCIVTLRIGLQG